jgi:mannitol/fructose-specific phosphotransferase system IIA component (Ntr-type)
MISLLEHVPEQHIVALVETKREDIIHRLVEHALPGETEAMRKQIFRDITAFSRKKEVAMGNGFILAHTRTEKITDIAMSIGLLAEEVKYRRGEIAHTVICIVVPDSMSRAYLSLMARLARLLSQPDAKDVFRSQDPVAVRELIRRFENPEETRYDQ